MALPPSPLNKIFKAKLRTMSRRSFEVAMQAPEIQALPRPLLWTDEQGREWTLAGRMAYLIYQATNSHSTNNQGLFRYLIQVGLQENTLNRSTLPHLPDTVLLVLAATRFLTPDTAVGSLIASALRHDSLPKGVYASGGVVEHMLDQLQSERESATPRRRVVLDEIAHKVVGSGVFQSVGGWGTFFAMITGPNRDILSPVVVKKAWNEYFQEAQNNFPLFTGHQDQQELNRMLDHPQCHDFIVDTISKKFEQGYGRAALMGAIDTIVARGEPLPASVLKSFNDDDILPFLAKRPHLKAQAEERVLQETTNSAPLLRQRRF